MSDLFALTSRKITDEGYLVAPANIARTGVQRYLASELGLDKSSGMDAKAIVRLYRPAEEVFKAGSMSTFDKAPLTVNHPPENVSSETWKKVAVGEAHDPTCAGDVMAAELIIRDKAAIKAVMDGKAELSNGYSFELDMTPGTAPDGSPYDGIQRDIRGNHVAIVDFARGGPALRIADHDTTPTKDKRMKTVTIGDVAIKFEDETAGSLAEKVVGDAAKASKTAQDAATAATARAEKAEKDLADEKAKSAKLVTDHAEALKAAEAKILKPEQVEALAVERSQVVADAAILAPDLKPEGKTVDAIRAEALKVATDSDEDCKAVAKSITDPKQAFDTVVTVLKRRDASAGDSRATGNDSAALGAASAGQGNRSGQPGPLSGRALLMYRERHGGKSPDQVKASA